MPIPVVCGGCGKRFKAPDRGAGRKVPCPACQATISIPRPLLAEGDDDVEYRLADEPLPTPAKAPSPLASSVPIATAPQLPESVGMLDGEPLSSPHSSAAEETVIAAPAKPAWVPPTKSSTPTWLRHLHWCLALAMIPLAVSIFVPHQPREETVAETPSAVEPEGTAPPAGSDSTTKAAGQPSPTPGEVPADVESKLNEILGQMSIDELLTSLPGRKLPGALLARDSYLHWLFALLAAAAYLTFVVFLAADKSAHPLHLLGLGVFTATGGILLLLFVQLAATIGVVRVRGAGAFIVLVLALIGLSYSAALDPESGLVASFCGFTFGVGLCEEVCKAIPILVYYRIGNQQSWRGAFLWGLASGAGFGVSEGVMYSQDFYNGLAGAGIYIVRFVSCVALHAIWAGSIGISINQRQDLLQEDLDEWWWYALAVLRLIAIPMVLHGLYDTLLKKDMPLLALVTAAASFGYLAWQISHLRTSDDDDERAAYVARYIRSKVAAARA